MKPPALRYVVYVILFCTAVGAVLGIYPGKSRVENQLDRIERKLDKLDILIEQE